MAPKKENKAPASNSAAASPVTSTSPATNSAPKKDNFVTTADGRKIVRPDQHKFEREKGTIEEKITDLENKLATVQKTISSFNDTRGPFTGENQKLFEERNQLSGESRKLKEEADRSFKQFEDLKKMRELKIKEANSIKERLPQNMTSNEKIDKAIADMEKLIESGTLKLIDEKKYITEIGNLKKAKKSVEVYEKKNKEIEETKKEVDAIKAKLDASNEAYRAASEKHKAIEAKITTIKQSQETDTEKRNSAYDEKNKIRAQIQELYEKKKALVSEFKQQKDEFNEHLKIENEKKREEQRVMKLQHAEERKKAEIERLKEERLKPQYVKEIAAATNLIKFLEETYKKDSKASEESAKKEGPVIDEKGIVALKSKSQRIEEDTFYAPKDKKQNKVSKEKTVKKGESIRFALDSLDQFWLVKVTPPATGEEVDVTIKALQEKKAEFETKQKEELIKAEKEVEEDLANAAKLAESKGKEKVEELEAQPAQ